MENSFSPYLPLSVTDSFLRDVKSHSLKKRVYKKIQAVSYYFIAPRKPRVLGVYRGLNIYSGSIIMVTGEKHRAGYIINMLLGLILQGTSVKPPIYGDFKILGGSLPYVKPVGVEAVVKEYNINTSVESEKTLWRLYVENLAKLLIDYIDYRGQPYIAVIHGLENIHKLTSSRGRLGDYYRKINQLKPFIEVLDSILIIYYPYGKTTTILHHTANVIIDHHGEILKR